jgi:hypothetical protein
LSEKRNGVLNLLTGECWDSAVLEAPESIVWSVGSEVDFGSYILSKILENPEDIHRLHVFERLEAGTFVRIKSWIWGCGCILPTDGEFSFLPEDLAERVMLLTGPVSRAALRASASVAVGNPFFLLRVLELPVAEIVREGALRIEISDSVQVGLSGQQVSDMIRRIAQSALIETDQAFIAAIAFALQTPVVRLRPETHNTNDLSWDDLETVLGEKIEFGSSGSRKTAFYPKRIPPLWPLISSLPVRVRSEIARKALDFDDSFRKISPESREFSSDVIQRRYIELLQQRSDLECDLEASELRLASLEARLDELYSSNAAKTNYRSNKFLKNEDKKRIVTDEDRAEEFVSVIVEDAERQSALLRSIQVSLSVFWPQEKISSITSEYSREKKYITPKLKKISESDDRWMEQCSGGILIYICGDQKLSSSALEDFIQIIMERADVTVLPAAGGSLAGIAVSGGSAIFDRRFSTPAFAFMDALCAGAHARQKIAFASLPVNSLSPTELREDMAEALVRDAMLLKNKWNYLFSCSEQSFPVLTGGMLRGAVCILVNQHDVREGILLQNLTNRLLASGWFVILSMIEGRMKDARRAGFTGRVSVICHEDDASCHPEIWGRHAEYFILSSSVACSFVPSTLRKKTLAAIIVAKDHDLKTMKHAVADFSDVDLVSDDAQEIETFLKNGR